MFPTFVVFDPTINIGGIVDLIAVLVVLFKMHNSNVNRLDSIEARLDIVYEWFKRFVIHRTHDSRKGD